jgi:hypothetical protein
VSGPQGALFPVVVEGASDPRFVAVLKRLSLVMEEEGFGRVTREDRVKLGAALFGAMYTSGGAAGELERRLNGATAPLISDEGKLDSYDCAAVAHEVRRKRGADSAIVIAIDERARVHIGCAVRPGSPSELIEARLMQKIDEAAHDFIEDVVLDLVVPEKVQAS